MSTITAPAHINYTIVASSLCTRDEESHPRGRRHMLLLSLSLLQAPPSFLLGHRCSSAVLGGGSTGAPAHHTSLMLLQEPPPQKSAQLNFHGELCPSGFYISVCMHAGRELQRGQL